MKKKGLIFFPYHFLAYSPTTLNLYKCLSNRFDVVIVAPEPTRFDQKKPGAGIKVDYYYDHTTSTFIKIKAAFLLPFMNIIYWLKKGVFKFSYATLKQYFKYNSLFKKYSSLEYDFCIVVDILFLSIAVRYMKNIHFLSLELTDDLLPLIKDTKPQEIKSVIIQNEDRYLYLFPEKLVKPFFIQNSVFWEEGKIVEDKEKDTIIFSGTGSENFGIYHFSSFISEYKHLYKGIVKGTLLPDVRLVLNEKYKDILESGILLVDESYTEADELVSYVSKYEIGVCFYDIEKFNKDRYNYITAPSGKMFTYFASGVPVIGSKIPGLNPVVDFNAGILIADYSPEAINNAVIKIKNNYDVYRQGCIQAAIHYSFDKQADKFISTL